MFPLTYLLLSPRVYHVTQHPCTPHPQQRPLVVSHCTLLPYHTFVVAQLKPDTRVDDTISDHQIFYTFQFVFLFACRVVELPSHRQVLEEARSNHCCTCGGGGGSNTIVNYTASKVQIQFQHLKNLFLSTTILTFYQLQYNLKLKFYKRRLHLSLLLIFK